jgi:hypothetical protein
MSGDDRGDLGDHRKKQHFSLSTENSSGGSSYGQILRSLSCLGKVFGGEWCGGTTNGQMAICPLVPRAVSYGKSTKQGLTP